MKRSPPRRSAWLVAPATLILVGLACSAGDLSLPLPGIVTATSTLAPPTSTPTPADTPTPTPSATPTVRPADLEATQLAATQTAALANIEPQLQQYGFSTGQGTLGWFHEPITLRLAKYAEAQADVAYPDLIVKDFVVQADITWNTSTGLAGCGFLVRAAPGVARPGYELLLVRLSGAPVWLFALYGSENRGSLVGSGNAPSLNLEQGSTNTVALIGQGNTFTTYLNGVKVGTAVNGVIAEGALAFLALQESGQTTCTFENAWLWVLQPGSGTQA